MSRFRWKCLIHIVLLSLSIGVWIRRGSDPLWNTTSILFIILILVQIVVLMRFIDRSNRDLIRFLDGLRHSDFSQSFHRQKNRTIHPELTSAMEAVMEAFRKERREKEAHFLYLQTLVREAGIGLIACRSGGQVDLYNPEAKRLLQIPRLKNIHKLKSRHPALYDAILRAEGGESVNITMPGRDTQKETTLSCRFTRFRQPDKMVTLVSMQNIQSALEEKEMDAWQNLIRVLTHEMMNSITPISSLASTARSLLSAPDASQKGNYLNDVQKAVTTIEKRSRGLLQFVEAYRKLTHVPKPDFSSFTVQDLFEGVSSLVQSRMDQRGIRFTTEIRPSRLKLTADRALVEQVLLNLIYNATDALEKISAPAVSLTAGMDERGDVLVQVRDNGKGISHDIREKIFIPFFTTKKEGSGIGLSLARQIMRLHGGTISVNAAPENGSIFSLSFPGLENRMPDSG